MILPVEDEFSDVLSKAQKGQGISTEALAARAGISENAIRAARRGEYEAATLAALGKELGLNVPALLELGKGDWRPAEIPEMEGLALVSSPFYDWKVNAVALWDGAAGKAVVFDTGSTADALIELLEGKGLELEAVILTHAHWDHFEGAADLVKRWPQARVFLGAKEGRIAVPTEAIDAGFAYELGKLKIKGFDTPGHTQGGMSFTVEGLERPLAVVGDALFAGSMGGANVSYADGLESVKRILALPADTVLAPGHGPLTTVAEERTMNCFAGGSV